MQSPRAPGKNAAYPRAALTAAAQEVTRLINERNETNFARKASQSGGSLTLVRLRSATEPPQT